jgi:hypothetical protein
VKSRAPQVGQVDSTSSCPGDDDAELAESNISASEEAGRRLTIVAGRAYCSEGILVCVGVDTDSYVYVCGRRCSLRVFVHPGPCVCALLRVYVGMAVHVCPETWIFLERNKVKPGVQR